MHPRATHPGRHRCQPCPVHRSRTHRRLRMPGRINLDRSRAGQRRVLIPVVALDFHPGGLEAPVAAQAVVGKDFIGVERVGVRDHPDQDGRGSGYSRNAGLVEGGRRTASCRFLQKEELGTLRG